MPTDCAFSLGSASLGVKPAHSGFGWAPGAGRARPLPPAVTIVTSRSRIGTLSPGFASMWRPVARPLRYASYSAFALAPVSTVSP